MLVLSRKKNQVIVVNGNIRVTLMDIRGDTCRIGFEAPPEVVIHRLEVFEKIQNETKQN